MPEEGIKHDVTNRVLTIITTNAAMTMTLIYVSQGFILSLSGDKLTSFLGTS